MKSKALVITVALASIGAWACSKSTSDDDSSGGSSSHAGVGGASATGGAGAQAGGGGTAAAAGKGGTGGTGGTGGSAMGPAITSAPPAWMPPADCGGIGDTCPQGIIGCSTKSTC